MDEGTLLEIIQNNEQLPWVSRSYMTYTTVFTIQLQICPFNQPSGEFHRLGEQTSTFDW